MVVPAEPLVEIALEKRVRTLTALARAALKGREQRVGESKGARARHSYCV
jgi:hypothetical protein